MKHTFANISRHPVSSWSREQVKAASEISDGAGITDYQFPKVDPLASSEEIVRQAYEFADKILGENIHFHGMVMGEYSLTIALIHELRMKGMHTYVACMGDGYQDEEIGVKQFQPRHFIQFREVA